MEGLRVARHPRVADAIPLAVWITKRIAQARQRFRCVGQLLESPVTLSHR
jgi:hypothetical protein